MGMKAATQKGSGGKLNPSAPTVNPRVMARLQREENDTSLLQNLLVNRAGAGQVTPFGETYLVNAEGQRLTPEALKNASIEDFAGYRMRSDISPEMENIMSSLQERALAKSGGIDRGAIEAAAMERRMGLLRPELERQREGLENRLAMQGLPIGSEAYADEMTRMERGQQEAISSAASDAMMQGLRETATERQLTQAELANALGGIQGIRAPQANVMPAQVSNIDISTPYLANAKMQSDAQNAKKGGTASLAGTGMMAAAMMSDIRLKENIQPIGVWGEHNAYSWDWNDEAEKLGLTGSSMGVIAQEVMETHPEAVMEKDGYLMVNYTKLGGINAH